MQSKRRTLPLRNSPASRQTASKSAKPARGKVKSKRPARTPEEQFPEILALPFVRFMGASPDYPHQCDYWAVKDVDPADAYMLGGRYALMTARFLHEDAKRNRPSILPRIIGAMIKRGKFWGTNGGDKFDPIAIGFVSCIGDVVEWAAANGTVRDMAEGLAQHYEATAKSAKDHDVAAYLTRASNTLLEFADTSRQSGREVRS